MNFTNARTKNQDLQFVKIVLVKTGKNIIELNENKLLKDKKSIIKTTQRKLKHMFINGKRITPK